MKAMLFERLIDQRDRKKIRKRTRIYNKDYDYRLHFEGVPDKEAISFLVVGDSGAGDESKPMKYHVADKMNKEKKIDLVLHVGDIVYLSGSRQGYQERFIKTYRHWLVKGEKHHYKNMVFNKPFLPIYGNHDYYDFGKILPGVGKLLGLLSDSIGTGSKGGRVFEEAFIEKDNKRLKNGSLPYQPNHHTRIPNRYYWYTHGPCAFFALDSNTLDVVKGPTAKEKIILISELELIEDEIKNGRKGVKHYMELEAKGELTEPLKISFENFFYQLAEREKKAALLKKRLDSNLADHDTRQLAWLEKALCHKDVQNKWKIVYLHHSLYSSEGGHTDDIATGGLRENLRKIFAKHKVNLVLSGHSHCFEWAMRKPASKYSQDPVKKLSKAERNICYLVTGGGGQDLRNSILEDFRADQIVAEKQDMFLDVAESKAYTATFGELETPEQFKNIYNYVRIDAEEHSLKVTPVGVGLKNKKPVHLQEFYTKVFDQKGMIVQTTIKKLKAIHIFKDKAPVAEWIEELGM